MAGVRCPMYGQHTSAIFTRCKGYAPRSVA